MTDVAKQTLLRPVASEIRESTQYMTHLKPLGILAYRHLQERLDVLHKATLYPWGPMLSLLHFLSFCLGRFCSYEVM